MLQPSSRIEREKTALDQMQDQTAPAVLSSDDLSLYRKAFAAQKTGKTEEADAALSQVSDPLLKGVLLGERYLSQDGEPSFSEMALWLAHYGDHAQAGDLYRMARERSPDRADFLTEPQFTGALKGFGNGHSKSVLGEEKHWISGLLAFRRQDMHSAFGHFQALLKADNGDLSSDDRAAAAFWAYRTASAAGDAATAEKYLGMAADEAPGFYSILAGQISGEHTTKLAQEKEASDNAAFLRKEPVRRAVALKAIGQDALAEKELRALFPIGSKEDRSHLVQLARMLGLPGAQMRMAIAGQYDSSDSDATYPLPHWKPTLGYHVEPALLFAIMRQESGFNPHAKSPSGATGVMQLMPATASAMARDARLKVSVEPAMNMTLGQRYLERLMDISSIGDNLVFIIASYNAGPGSVMAWQKNLHYRDDPLLFIESIPNTQTRDYVVRVMGNYWVYSEMLGGYENASAAALAQNHWPYYERSEKQMASMLSRLDTNGAE